MSLKCACPSEYLGQEDRPVAVFLVLTCVLSSCFYALAIVADDFRGPDHAYATGLMWSPAVAAIATLKLFGMSLDSIGWRWPQRKFLFAAYLTPLLYSLTAYGIMWCFGIARVPDLLAIRSWVSAFELGPLSTTVSVVLRFLLVSTVFWIPAAARALGEEIGWRGLLVPTLAKRHNFTFTALFSGTVWAAWHLSILLFANYNTGAPPAYSVFCFTLLVIAFCVVFAWLRLKSQSIWPCVVLHATHNVFVHGFFTPITVPSSRTPYLIDEFGIGIPLLVLLLALAIWRRRRDLSEERFRSE